MLFNEPVPSWFLEMEEAQLYRMSAQAFKRDVNCDEFIGDAASGPRIGAI